MVGCKVASIPDVTDDNIVCRRGLDLVHCTAEGRNHVKALQGTVDVACVAKIVQS